MRQRVTYLHHPSSPFDPSSLEVTKGGLTVKSLKAAKEHHLSIGLHELPDQFRAVLDQAQELYIRWASPQAYDSVAPFTSRTSPGLHVFFTPQAQDSDKLCPFLHTAFGDDLRCYSANESFTEISVLSERFSSSTSWQYHQLLPSLDRFHEYIQSVVCGDDKPCENFRDSQHPTYLDINYDAIAHAVTIISFWDSASDSRTWDEQLLKSGDGGKLEVGIFSSEKPLEPEEVSLSGFLTDVGEDAKPAPTLFSFPSRHHSIPTNPSSSYTISFPPPTGLHPTLKITFPSSPSHPANATCSLFTYLTLPSHLFPDKYQFSDALFLASHNLRHVRSIHGETDLEAPDWVIRKWGSSMLVELATPPNPASSQWAVTVPLHLRYLAPTRNTSGLVPAHVPWPVVFWACHAEDGLKMSVNPFDRVHLGYDGLFGPKTMFYHLNPSPRNASSSSSSSSLVEIIQVPVLDLDKARWVETGTVVTILAGFLWICWKLWEGVTRSGREEGETEKRRTGKKKAL
ncbi:MAG: protease B nonderepressible form [Piccolia ochrophora]|nr:MAG: protease B nonderepressible form [Piccolia ochrophora]